MLREYLKTKINYAKDENVLTLRLLKTLENDIRQDIINAFEMAKPFIDQNPELYKNSTSFFDFLCKSLNINLQQLAITTPPETLQPQFIPCKHENIEEILRNAVKDLKSPGNDLQKMEESYQNCIDRTVVPILQNAVKDLKSPGNDLQKMQESYQNYIDKTVVPILQNAVKDLNSPGNDIQKMQEFYQNYIDRTVVPMLNQTTQLINDKLNNFRINREDFQRLEENINKNYFNDNNNIIMKLDKVSSDLVQLQLTQNDYRHLEKFLHKNIAEIVYNTVSYQVKEQILPQLQSVNYPQIQYTDHDIKMSIDQSIQNVFKSDFWSQMNNNLLTEIQGRLEGYYEQACIDYKRNLDTQYAQAITTIEQNSIKAIESVKEENDQLQNYLKELMNNLTSTATALQDSQQKLALKFDNEPINTAQSSTPAITMPSSEDYTVVLHNDESNNLKHKIEKLEDENREHESDIRELKRQLRQKEDEIAELNEKIDGLNRKASKVSKLQENIHEKTEELHNIKGDLKRKISECETMEQNYEKKIKQLKEENNQNINKQIHDAKTTYDDLTRKIETLKEQLNKCKEKLKLEKEQIIKSNDEYNREIDKCKQTMQTKIDEYNREINKLNSIITQKELELNQKISEKDNIIQGKLQEIEQLKDQFKRGDNEKLTQLMDTKARLERQIQQLEIENNNYKGEIDKKCKEINVYSNTQTTLNEKIQNKGRELAEKMTEITNLHIELNKLKSDIGTKDFEINNLKMTQTSQNSITESCNPLKIENEEYRKKNSDLNRKISENNQSIQTLTKENETLKIRIKDLTDELTKLRESFLNNGGPCNTLRVSQINHDLEAKKEEYNKLEEMLREKDDRIRVLRITISENKSQIENLKEKLQINESKLQELLDDNNRLKLNVEGSDNQYKAQIKNLEEEIQSKDLIINETEIELQRLQDEYTKKEVENSDSCESKLEDLTKQLEEEKFEKEELQLIFTNFRADLKIFFLQKFQNEIDFSDGECQPLLENIKFAVNNLEQKYHSIDSKMREELRKIEKHFTLTENDFSFGDAINDIIEKLTTERNKYLEELQNFHGGSNLKSIIQGQFDVLYEFDKTLHFNVDNNPYFGDGIIEMITSINKRTDRFNDKMKLLQELLNLNNANTDEMWRDIIKKIEYLLELRILYHRNMQRIFGEADFSDPETVEHFRDQWDALRVGNLTLSERNEFLEGIFETYQRYLKKKIELPEFFERVTESDICSICLDNIKIDSNIFSLDCNHKYCFECFKGLIDREDFLCPQCRQAMFPGLLKTSTVVKTCEEPGPSGIQREDRRVVKKALKRKQESESEESDTDEQIDVKKVKKQNEELERKLEIYEQENTKILSEKELLEQQAKEDKKLNERECEDLIHESQMEITDIKRENERLVEEMRTLEEKYQELLTEKSEKLANMITDPSFIPQISTIQKLKMIIFRLFKAHFAQLYDVLSDKRVHYDAEKMTEMIDFVEEELRKEENININTVCNVLLSFFKRYVYTISNRKVGIGSYDEFVEENGNEELQDYLEFIMNDTIRFVKNLTKQR